MTSSTSSNLVKLKKDPDGNFILPMSNGKLVIQILRLGKMGGVDYVDYFDFEQVPQGYVHICGSSVRKAKGVRMKKTEHIDGAIIDPTDDQIIDYAKRMIARTDMYGQSSGKNPDNYVFEIVEKKNG
jgi:hypothetical protein